MDLSRRAKIVCDPAVSLAEAAPSDAGSTLPADVSALLIVKRAANEEGSGKPASRSGGTLSIS
ncbi:hypothetical protein [Bosea sp. (in: a-proteobacteria)]|jgi:hypothetical protein|uniref:hypothetical protein n=1 Tax=Bosea sp. (in: a-proteobacteria) TaxID=1871050 RepID=UPI002DDD12C4|nr:hypothetical protein [Bosea sp. (in: a-proteobacteria)]HEV2509666.1 hypothetical protein [Bosea sp. (in: a-proteobacteria)]